MNYPAAKQRALPTLPLLVAGGCVVVGVALFGFSGNAARGYVDTPSLIWWWISQWLDPVAEAEHGWLVLALSGWLFWRNLKATPPHASAAQEATAAPDPIWPAVLAMFLALALHAVGFVAQFSRASIVAALLFTWGALQLAGGRRWGAAAMFPLGFMLFSVPLSVLDEVGLPLRLWVVAAGDRIAHAAGIDVIRSGTQLLAPDGRFNYDVAAACSGVRSLLALSALAVLLGYLSFRSWGRRAVVALVCLPLVYLGNVARIVAIVFAAQWGGSEWGDRAHAVMGWGVFAIVLGGVFATVTLLQRWRPEVPPESAAAGDRTGGNRTSNIERSTSNIEWTEAESGALRAGGLRSQEVSPARASPARQRALWALMAVLGVFACVELSFFSALRRAPPSGGAGIVLAADGVAPVELPAFLGVEWAGRRTEVTAIERAVLPPDTGFSRKLYVAVADARRQVLLSIVLSGRDRTSIHRPELCLVGQGWTITGKTEHRFTQSSAGTFPATILRVRRDVPTARGPVAVPALVAYWFVNADTIVATHPQRLVRDVWNRLAHGRVDRWAYVLMQVDATDGEASALARMQEVLDGTLPAFQRVRP